VVNPGAHGLRIVVDGASGAGKTSTARALGARLGQPVATAGEDADGRTVLFDWMEYVGGRHEGAPIRAQLVTVPGHLPDRRAALLQTADVVLFVADSTRRGLATSAAAYRELRDQVALRARPPAVLVQANKRDLADAVPLPLLRDALGLDEQVLVIETIALDGDGVRQAFVYAVRLALPGLAAAPADRAAEAQRRPDDLAAHLAVVEADGTDVHRPGDGVPDPFSSPEEWTDGGLGTETRAWWDR
jgi:signal recognition particle receptor subunit beta